MKTLERFGNILIEGKPGAGKTSLIEVYLKEIKGKNKIIGDFKCLKLYAYKEDKNTKYYSKESFDELYLEILSLINKKNKRTTYIILDEFNDFIRKIGKNKTYKLFDYISMHSREVKIKFIIASQIKCFAPKMKHYANTYIVLNSKY